MANSFLKYFTYFVGLGSLRLSLWLTQIFSSAPPADLHTFTLSIPTSASPKSLPLPNAAGDATMLGVDDLQVLKPGSIKLNEIRAISVIYPKGEPKRTLQSNSKSRFNDAPSLNPERYEAASSHSSREQSVTPSSDLLHSPLLSSM